METTEPTPAPEPTCQPDILVRSNANRVFVFKAATARAREWLYEHVPQEFHAMDGSVVVGPLKAAQLRLWLTLAGLDLR